MLPKAYRAPLGLALIALAYLYGSLGIFQTWQRAGANLVTGDEPHYLVMADGLVRDGTFEQTAAYSREFNERRFYPPGLGPKGGVPDHTNTHATPGPHGLYNVHGVGLPILIAPATLSGRINVVKVYLLLFGLLALGLFWTTSGRFTSDLESRLWATSLPLLGLPFLSGFSQIYPDLIGGLISLWAVARLLDERPGAGMDLLAALAIAFQPWMQIKFLAASLLAIASLVGLRLWHRRWKTSAALLLLWSVSMVALGAYNTYAFGKMSGPYGTRALELTAQALTVFFGLLLDQSQGLFLQCLVGWVGAFFLFSYVRRYPVAGWATVLLAASTIVPNSMHYNWYGGYSFAGRFMWSGLVVGMAPTIFGLVKLREAWGPRFRFLALAFLGIQAFLAFRTKTFHLYNSYGELADATAYRSLYEPLQAYLPIFTEWTFATHHGPNYVFVALLAAVLVAGARRVRA